MPWGLRYRAFACYADGNMGSCRMLPAMGERRIGVRKRALPIVLQAIKLVGRPPLCAGLRHSWIKGGLLLTDAGLDDQLELHHVDEMEVRPVGTQVALELCDQGMGAVDTLEARTMEGPDRFMVVGVIVTRSAPDHGGRVDVGSSVVPVGSGACTRAALFAVQCGQFDRTPGTS